MRKHTIITVCTFFILASGSLSAAFTIEELGKWWKNSGIVKELGLSDTQIDQIERHYLHHRMRLAELVGKLKMSEDRMKSLMNSEPIDEAGILAQAETVAGIRKDLEIARATMMLSIRKELNSEQWGKLQEMREFEGSLAVPEPSSSRSGAGAYDVGDGIKKPISIYLPMPPYTKEARDAKVEGIVLLKAVVRKDGSVGEVKVLRGLGYGLDENAVNTVSKEWRFQPGTKDGQPTDIQINIEVSFRLY